MSDRTRLSRILSISRRKALSLCLATALASTATAHPIAHTETAFVDPNGLEIDGAGSVQSSTSSGTFDLALLAIWAAATLSLVGMAVSADRRHKGSLQAARERSSMPVQQET
jgi:hypothetical protein